VYLNGHLPEKAKTCWASSLEELNEVAFLKLGLAKQIKQFFTEDGKPVSKKIRKIVFFNKIYS